MSATDSPRANSARIYEYILAGRTEGVPFTQADIDAAEQIAINHPNTVQGMNLHHLYIEVAAQAYARAGIQCFLDIGAGLPTSGALHMQPNIPSDARIIYVDHDIESVAYGQQILSGQHRYILGRLEDMDAILAEAEPIFGTDRRVGVNLISIVHFVDDAKLQHALQVLYDWAAPGSLVAVTSTPGERTNTGYQKATSEYKQRTGLQVYVRMPEEVIELFAPWQPLVTPHGVEDQVEQLLGRSIARDEYRGLLGYGGIFVKQGD